MTEQELRTSITPCIMAGNTWFVFDEIKAYADARVAEKDTELAELKAESKYWKDRWEAGNKLQDEAFNSEIENYHEVKRLNAEIKRLREGIQKEAKIQRDILRCELDEGMHSPAKRIRECVAEDLEKILSPAPVTETKNEDQE